MAQSSNAFPSEMDDEIDVQDTLDNTCPECGTESIASYLDRYGTYEYCTNCDWSDEDPDEGGTRELIGRQGRGRMDD